LPFGATGNPLKIEPSFNFIDFFNGVFSHSSERGYDRLEARQRVPTASAGFALLHAPQISKFLLPNLVYLAHPLRTHGHPKSRVPLLSVSRSRAQGWVDIAHKMRRGAGAGLVTKHLLLEFAPLLRL
jgi:hypothetical protein